MAIFGLGLGGLLAREVVSRGAPVDDLLLWAAPASGRAFVRELQAFARLQTGRSPESPDASLPEGWLETGGFVVSVETFTSLRQLAPVAASGSALKRALLLDRDGVRVDPALVDQLRDAGVVVTEDAGLGWADLVSHPEKTLLSPGVAELAAEWLRADLDSGPDRPSVDRRGESDRLRLVAESGSIAETAITVDRDFGSLFGILAEPDSAPKGEFCALFLNAGAVRHTGPNRLWVETARRWAAKGVPAVRLDLEGIGESDGDELRRRRAEHFYGAEFEQQVVAVLDELEHRGIGSRFILVGLCAGAYWSVRAALRDPRVELTVMLNGGAFSWDEKLFDRRRAQRFDRAYSREWWGKLIRGTIKRPGPREIAGLFAARARRSARDLRRRLSRDFAGRTDIAADLDRVQNGGRRVVMAFSDDEELAEELAAEGILERVSEWPVVDFTELPGNDHTLRSVEAQRAAATLLDAELERVVTDAARAQSP